MTMAGIMQTTQYLTLKLDNEVFALEISKVREVLDFTSITRVPRVPEFMRGVINLRGSVVPVIDLRLTLGMSQTERTANTCVIIVEVTMDEETIIIGTIADSVQEVLDLGPDLIEPAPKIGTSLNTEFIKGMGRQNDQFVIILDIDKVLTSGDLLLVHGVLAETAQEATEYTSSDACTTNENGQLC